MTDPRVAFEAWAFDLGICADEWPSLRLAWMAGGRHEREASGRKVAEENEACAMLVALGGNFRMADAIRRRAAAAAIRARSNP